VLTDDEVRAFWLACEQERPAMCVLTRLRLVSAQRGVELENIRWDDLDLKDPANSWWTVPSEIAKNGQMHRVPLTKRALALIALMPKLDGIDYVFPGRIGNGVVNKPCGDARKAALRIAKAAGLGNVWGRDLRRTASTNMAKAGVPQPDIAKILNHQEDGPRATSVYNRYAYDKEKRAALNTWERALARILKTKTTPHA
jgi:integrase